MMLIAVVTAALSACSHNAPAPVFDATLGQRVEAGLKRSRLPSKKSITTNREALPNQASIIQVAYPKPQTGTAISNVPTSQTIKETEHKTPSRLKQHRVQAGDTLYSIAWQYSLDPKELARINGIKSGAIYPNQVLSLNIQNDGLNIRNGVKPSAVYNKASLMASLDREILNQKTEPAKHKQAIINSKLQHTKLAGNKTSANPAFVVSDSVKRWIWPVNGTVIRPFSNRSNSSSSSNKGVDIAAKHGASVRATANGKVVYSGSGLRGYGQLVIIKHNELFLSAYAHNDKVHVKENEFVKAGQKIADLGKSDSDQDKLHFEIRYKGKPVDPLNYLPKSG